MKSEVKEEIQTYIRYINENDFRDKCEEYIQMFFFLSQMMLEESLGADERVIQSMAQKMVGLLGQDLDIDFASPNDGMYGGLVDVWLEESKGFYYMGKQVEGQES